MNAPPARGEPIGAVPDWVCEILSPPTASYDSLVNHRFYAQIGVGHRWYVDPTRRELEVCRLVEGKWLRLGIFGGHERVRAEPFEAVAIELAEWWTGEEPGEEAGHSVPLATECAGMAGKSVEIEVVPAPEERALAATAMPLTPPESPSQAAPPRPAPARPPRASRPGPRRSSA